MTGNLLRLCARGQPCRGSKDSGDIHTERSFCERDVASLAAMSRPSPLSTRPVPGTLAALRVGNGDVRRDVCVRDALRRLSAAVRKGMADYLRVGARNLKLAGGCGGAATAM